MAPHDSRNIFCNNNEETELPVVFPHHLLMIAVASTASKGSTAKSCPQEGLESTKSKTNNCTSSEDLEKEKTPELKTEKEEEQSEIRQIIEMTCTVEVDENSSETKLSLWLRLEDQMNRQLSCSVSEDETGIDLANELVEYGLISELDRDKVANTIDEHLEVNEGEV